MKKQSTICLINLFYWGFVLGGCFSPGLPTLTSYETAIIHGEPDTNPDHGAVVLITYGSGWKCTGTLIKKNLVLTADFCTYDQSPSSISVYFGDEIDGTEVRSVSDIYIHPDHVPIIRSVPSVIRLSTDAPAGIRPIAILPRELGLTFQDEGHPIEFSGFGIVDADDDHLDFIKYHSQNKIAMLCQGPNSCILNSNIRVEPKSFAYLSSDEPGYGMPCYGDGGGPTFIVRKVSGIEKVFVAGIHSYGDSECEEYGGSIDVSVFADWIASIDSDEECANFQDDDNDTFVDCDDPDCADSQACQPVDEDCSNNIDDDGDELIDCDDPDCGNILACQPVDEECSNNIDDDNDGLVDCADSDCDNAQTCQPVDEDCSNNIDDDDDGLIDCDDPDCDNAQTCQPVDEDCSNNIDDDGDEQVDCNDSDCRNNTACLSDTGLGCGVQGSQQSSALCLLFVGFLLIYSPTRRKASVSKK